MNPNPTLEMILAGLAPTTNPPTSSRPGLYTFYVKSGQGLPGIELNTVGLIYTGMTESSLDVRNHITHDHSGFSTLRRSLGAILKTSLLLQAFPRAKGSSKTNITNYRFQDEGELRLTKWMAANLIYSYFPLESGLSEVFEPHVIARQQPPLNLTGWANPQKQKISALRAACRAEADKNK